MELLGVVPIFTGAGAALLPTIAAAIASLAAVALKPREWLRICRRRPVAAGASAVTMVFCLALAGWWLTPAAPSRPADRAERRSTVRCDWARVAENLIALEQAGKGATSLVETQRADAPLILGRDFSRCGYDGGPAPARLKPLWRFRPEETMFLSSPVVAGDRVFVAGCQAELGGYTGLLACLDAATGKPLWQLTEADDEPLRPFFSSPALTRDGRYLIVGQGLHTDRDCALLCVDAATGRLHWKVKTPLHIESSPAIFGDMAVVGAGAVEGSDGKAVGDPGYVIAVRIRDGAELWRQPVNDPESSPAIDEQGVVYIGSGFNGNEVLAIRSDPDEELRGRNLDRIAWRTPLPQPVTAAVTLAGESVIAGGGNGNVVQSHQNAQGFVAAMDRKSGAIRWQTTFQDAVLGGIACRGETLICPLRTGEVAALALADGRVLWRTRISGTAPVLAGCAFTGRRVYAVSSDGYLAVLDAAAAGKLLEKTYLNDQARPGTGLTLSGPQIVGGRVVVGSETGGLHCLVGSERAE